MTVVDRGASAHTIMDAVGALSPAIAARAPEIESARRIPPDLLAQLVDAGCFRVLLPTSHGGAGAGLPAALRVFEALARADGSVGWTVMIGASAWLDLVELPRATFDAVFDGSDVIIAGAFSPSGSIEAVDDGYRVTGRWGFASGCEHATWLYGNCVEGVEDGMPRLRGALLRPDDVVIEDTWTVSGLRGTGSHHFHVDDLRLPAERTFVPLAGEPCIDEAIAHVPTPAAVAVCVASVATGIARGALDDIVALAAGKVPLLSPGPLATNPWFQHQLAAAHTELRAARALLAQTAESVWAAATAGEPVTLAQRAEVRAAGAWAADRAAAVVDAAHRAGGGSSVYADNPLQRRQRDIHALTQHFIVRPDTLTAAGAVLAGQDPGVMVF